MSVFFSLIIIKWYTEEEDILNFLMKKGELGQLAERRVHGRMDLFSPDLGFYVEMPLFSELQALNSMSFSPIMSFILDEWGELWELEISFAFVT